MIERFLAWLGETPWSVAFLESLYMWPFVESAHVLTLGLFVGTTAMMDLRLLGIAFRKVPVTAFTGRLLPWTRIGFVIMTATGLLLFYSQPLRYYHNIFFRVKVLVLILAGVNAWIFHRGAHRSAGDWDWDTRPPARGPDRRRRFPHRLGTGGDHRPPHRLQLVRLRHPASAGWVN